MDASLTEDGGVGTCLGEEPECTLRLRSEGSLEVRLLVRAFYHNTRKTRTALFPFPGGRGFLPPGFS